MKIPDKPNWKGPIDEQINEAMDRGEFSNLKGKGRPLDLSADLSRMAEMRSKLHREANYSAPWEDVAREVERAQKDLEAFLIRALAFLKAGRLSARADPERVNADFRAALREAESLTAMVNSQILRHNLLLPRELPRLHRVRVQLEAVLGRLAPEVAEEFLPGRLRNGGG